MTTKHNAGEVAHHARMVWGDKAAAKLLENANPNDTTTTVGGNDR